MKFKTSPDGSQRIVLVCYRDSKQRDDVLTSEPVQCSTVPGDDFGDCRLDLAGDLFRLRGIQLFYDSRVAGQVGTDYRCPPALWFAQDGCCLDGRSLSH